MSSRNERECNDNAPLQDKSGIVLRRERNTPTPSQRWPNGSTKATIVTLCHTLGVPSILKGLKLCDYILIKRKKSRGKFCVFLLNCVVTWLITRANVVVIISTSVHLNSWSKSDEGINASIASMGANGIVCIRLVLPRLVHFDSGLSFL